MDKAPQNLNCKETEFQLKHISLKALRWHEGAKHRVIALHGWLDNAATFSMLLPHLPDLDCVALDLAGQGRSGYRSGDSSYDIWKDVPEIVEVADALGWEQFSILGHSRGAMISTLVAGTLPQRLEKICLLDAVTPLTIKEDDLPALLAKSIEQIALLDVRKSTFFSSFSNAVNARTTGRFPLSYEASNLLAERSVVQGDEGYYWRYDPRLAFASGVKLSDRQVRPFVDRFPCKACAILATNGVLPDSTRPTWIDEHPNLDIKVHEGEHHLQLGSDPESITKLAAEIYAYFEQD